MMRREHPEHELLTRPDVLAVGCWILGDKYDIPEFQDEAMLALLVSIANNSLTKDMFSEIALGVPIDSKLRALIAEEATRQWHNGVLNRKKLENLGQLGFTVDLMRAEGL